MELPGPNSELEAQFQALRRLVASKAGFQAFTQLPKYNTHHRYSALISRSDVPEMNVWSSLDSYCFMINSVLQFTLTVILHCASLDLFACWTAQVLSGFNKPLCCSKVWSHGWTRTRNVNISPYISVYPFSFSFLSICLFIGLVWNHCKFSLPFYISFITVRLLCLNALRLLSLSHLSVMFQYFSVSGSLRCMNWLAVHYLYI